MSELGEPGGLLSEVMPCHVCRPLNGEGLASVTRQKEGAKFCLIPDTLGFLSNLPQIQTSCGHQSSQSLHHILSQKPVQMTPASDYS